MVGGTVGLPMLYPISGPKKFLKRKKRGDWLSQGQTIWGKPPQLLHLLSKPSLSKFSIGNRIKRNLFNKYCVEGGGRGKVCAYLVAIPTHLPHILPVLKGPCALAHFALEPFAQIHSTDSHHGKTKPWWDQKKKKKTNTLPPSHL